MKTPGDAVNVTFAEALPALPTVSELVTAVFGAVVPNAMFALLKESTAPRAVMFRVTSTTLFVPVVTSRVSP